MNTDVPTPLRKHGLLKFCLLVVVLVGAVIGGTAWFKKTSAINSTCEWAQMNPLPVPAGKVHVQTKGTAFTREFIVTFTGEREAIHAWLNASPGTRSLYRDPGLGGIFHHALAPGGGAQFAEITVSQGGTKVVIRAYWS